MRNESIAHQTFFFCTYLFNIKSQNINELDIDKYHGKNNMK